MSGSGLKVPRGVSEMVKRSETHHSSHVSYSLLLTNYLLPRNLNPRPLQPQLINYASVTISTSGLPPLCLRPCQNGKSRLRMWSDVRHSGVAAQLSLLHTVAVKHFSTTQIFMSRVNAIMLTGNNCLLSYGPGLHFMAFPFISFAQNSTERLEMLHCSV